MTPVTQTKVVIKNSSGDMVVRGNCYAAAIASLLDLPITEVPNVEVLFHIDSLWFTVMQEFLLSKGLELVSVAGHLYDGTYYFVSGPAARGVNHICIYQNGSLVHDPHPTREGLLQEEDFEIIQPHKP